MATHISKFVKIHFLEKKLQNLSDYKCLPDARFRESLRLRCWNFFSLYCWTILWFLKFTKPRFVRVTLALIGGRTKSLYPSLQVKTSRHDALGCLVSPKTRKQRNNPNQQPHRKYFHKTVSTCYEFSTNDPRSSHCQREAMNDSEPPMKAHFCFCEAD